MANNNGIFITFEGGEGSGKSTQAKLLNEFLNNKGTQTILTREPGGTKVAESIRNILVNSDSGNMSSHTELLLHFAARADHIEQQIKPALAENKWVICDRFTDSTYAYQARGHGIEEKIINQIDEIATGNFSPNFTFIMDIEAEAGLERANIRNHSENRYEEMGLEFHKRVNSYYRDTAKQNPDRYHIIDATKKIDEIHQDILNFIDLKNLL